MASTMRHSGILLLCVVLAIGAAHAFPRFQAELPSIPTVEGALWPGVGHVARAGGGARNAFGEAFEAAGYVWTPELCNADSDLDGFTNGQELGDPTCTWVKGQPQRVAVSHPGLANSMPPQAG